MAVHASRPAARVRGPWCVVKSTDVGSEEEQSVVALDIAGGRRRYLFRCFTDDEGAAGAEFNESLATMRKFVLDPSARLVLSIGGGGFRLFAATAVLKLLDLLVNDRTRVAEVWGCSGGALVGHVYANGLEPGRLDALGFELAHGRHPDVNNGSNWSLVQMAGRIALDQLRGERRDPDIARWLALIEEAQGSERPNHPRRPFYSVAVNPKRRSLFALTDPEFISSSCRDFMVPSARAHAVAASTAVPFVLPSQRHIAGWGDDDVWIDGSIMDENPLMLPFLKWSRERAADPKGTPERFKVLLVDLNARSREVALVQKLCQVPVVGPLVVRRATRTFDMLLDSRFYTAVSMLSALPNVEVLCLKLSLGRLGLRAPQDIPGIILSGRCRRSWQMSTFGSGI